MNKSQMIELHNFLNNPDLGLDIINTDFKNTDSINEDEK